MHPIFINLGGLEIHWYGVCIAIAFVLFLLTLRYLARGTGRDMNTISNMMVILVISAAIGARGAYVIEHWSLYADNPMDIFRLDEGGIMFYGGFLCVILALCLFAKYHKERTLDFLDWVVTPLPLAHAIGRVGCFLEGCCFGAQCPADSPWAVVYPKGSHAWYAQVGDGLIGRTDAALPLFPSQLFEAAGNLIIFAILMVTWRRRKFEGQQGALYFVLYAILRYVIETLRSDQRAQVGMFTISQAISLGIFAVGVGVLVWRVGFSRHPTRPQSTSTTSADID